MYYNSYGLDKEEEAKSMYIGLQHLHINLWFILIILFFVTYFLIRSNKEKPAKILHMVTRLFYVLILGSGIGMVIILGFPVTFVIKGILAISLVYFMERILGKKKKNELDGKMESYYWIMFAVTIMLVVLIGYRVITFG